jgi:serine/threonine-protein kinase
VLEIGEQLLDSGMRVGPYSLIERLAAGGMGEIWLARHQLLARPAAVKIVRDTVTVGEEASTRLQRFSREAQATADLESPHTVRLFDFGTTDTGTFYYVMERLHGMDLQRMVERHGPMPAERAVFLLQQACLSLSEAHGLGLIHRDIKPGNLFICRLAHEYDFVKILDFGVVSRRGRHDATASITVTGLVLGTPAFIAPELVVGPGTFDARADIYSLGCVAFWLLTGRRPFQGLDPVQLLTQHSQIAPEPPSAIAETTIPAELDALVLECLSKDPAGRPRTADALRARLEAVPVRRWDQARAKSWWELHEADLVVR